MKKIISLIILLGLVTTFCGCNIAPHKKPRNYSSQGIPVETTNEPTTYISKIFDKVYVKMLGSKQVIDLSKSFEEQLLASKESKEPLLSDKYSKVGEIIVIYAGKIESTEFGEVYIDSNRDMYIYSYENGNKALYKVNDFTE